MMNREELQEMYSRYAGERKDGGQDFAMDDHLHGFTKSRCVSLSVRTSRGIWSDTYQHWRTAATLAFTSSFDDR